MIEKNSQFNVKISQHNKIEKFQLRWKSNPRYDITQLFHRIWENMFELTKLSTLSFNENIIFFFKSD